MAQLRSTANFTEIVIEETISYVEYRYSLEGAKLSSSVSEKTMTYRANDIIFSFESIAQFKYRNVRVAIDLMKNGIVVRSVSPLYLGSSSVKKYYYYALIKDEANYMGIRSLQSNIIANLAKFMELDSISNMFDNYKTLSISDISCLVLVKDYMKFLFNNSYQNVTYRLNNSGSIVRDTPYITEMNRFRLKASQQRNVGITCRIVMSDIFKRLLTSYVGQTTSSFKIFGNNGLCIQTVTSHFNPGETTIIQDHYLFFEIPVVTGTSKADLLDLLMEGYNFKYKDISCYDLAYSDNIIGETLNCEILEAEHANTGLRTLEGERIDSRGNTYKVYACNNEIGDAKKLLSGKYLLMVDIERLLFVYDDCELEDLVADGYQYIYVVVNKLDDITAVFDNWVVYADGVITRVIQSIAVTEIWKHFKEKF